MTVFEAYDILQDKQGNYYLVTGVQSQKMGTAPAYASIELKEITIQTGRRLAQKKERTVKETLQEIEEGTWR